MRFVPVVVLVGTCAAAGPAAAGEVELARIERVERGLIHSQVFALDRDHRVEIGGTKLARSRAGEMTSAWILDSATRQVVWRLEQAREYKHHGKTCSFKSSAELTGGVFEVYLTTHPPQHAGVGLWSWLKRMMSFDRDDPDEALTRLEIWVRGNGRPLGDNPPERVRDLLAADAFVTLVCIGHDGLASQGFRLDDGAGIRVYTIGEVTSDGAFDSGWIVDATTRERVWSLDYWGSDHAGGARKNRLANTVIYLEAGEYAAVYSTDDSHSCPRFNAAPPYDPFAWGITLRIEDPARRSSVSTFSYTDALDRNVIARLDRVRNNEQRTAGFTLRQTTEVLVHAVGEGSDGEMYDYGWIVDARTRKTVWEMRYRASEHAGGGDKNRVVQEVLSLPAGSYIVHYTSDGSHSFGDWNTSPPFEPERWGITLVALGAGDISAAVTDFDPDDDPTVLAAIRRVGNRAARHERFSIDRDQEVVVYAVGEGSRGTMYDYGWIEHAGTRTVIWQMEYWMTDHAGGADKNRVYRAPLDLPAGEYTLHYTSDGSHAYRSWNAAPPHDPESWGVTVLATDTPRHLEDPDP